MALRKAIDVVAIGPTKTDAMHQGFKFNRIINAVDVFALVSRWRSFGNAATRTRSIIRVMENPSEPL